MAVVLLVIGCVSYRPEGVEDYGLTNMASGGALRSLLNGEAASYDAAMDERDADMNDPEKTEVIMKPVDEIPVAFMGDALDTDMLDYVLSLYQEYYEKQRVTVATQEE